MMRSKIPGMGLALGLLLMTSMAAADVDRATLGKDFTNYEFKDDLLNSDVSFPSGANIKVRPKAPRVTLIRPRTHFVSEMMKSVERL